MSTDEPVCNTQLILWYKKSHDHLMFFSPFLQNTIIKAVTKKKKKRWLMSTFWYCDFCCPSLIKLQSPKAISLHKHTENVRDDLGWSAQSNEDWTLYATWNFYLPENIRKSYFQPPLLSPRLTLVWTGYWLLQMDSSPLSFSFQFPLFLLICFHDSVLVHFAFSGVFFFYLSLVWKEFFWKKTKTPETATAFFHAR